MIHVYKSRHGGTSDPERCAQAVHDDYGAGFHQCYRKGIIEEDGHKWCRQHLPSAVKAKREASAAAYRAEQDEIDRQRKAATALKTAEQAVIEVAVDLFDQAASIDDLEAAVIAYRKLR